MDVITTYFTNIGPLETVGVAGFICYISAFGSVQLGLMDGNSALFSMINILAASLVAISLIAEFNLASALIQYSWIVIGIIGLLLRVQKSRRKSHQMTSAVSRKVEVQ